MSNGKFLGKAISYCLWALLAVFVMQGCASSKKAKTEDLKDRTADVLLLQMVQKQMHPEWMSAKARIKYDDGYMSVGGTANITIRKDSLVWVSVRKLGFEVARAMVTPDSVYVIDRLNNEYLVEDLDYLAREYQVPADFGALQAIFLGNPVFFAKRGFSVSNEEDVYLLKGTDGRTESQYWLEGKSLQLLRMVFDEPAVSRHLDIKLEDYQPEGDQGSFSYLRQLQMDSKDTGALTVEIAFSQVEFNVPKSVQFEIPNRYTRTD